MNIKHKNLAFTLAEVLLTLSVLGVLVAITTPILKNAIPDFNIYRIKKINVTLKDTVDDMLNRDAQYEGKHDFSNTGVMVLGDTYVANVNTFRNVFLKHVNMKSSFNCYAYGANGVIECYISTDNLVWAIPDTDFEEIGVVEVENKNGYGTTSKYAPITVYPNYEPKKAQKNLAEYMRNNAVIYGIRRDGKVMFLDKDYDCENNKDDKKTMQCLAINEVASSRMKRR